MGRSWIVRSVLVAGVLSYVVLYGMAREFGLVCAEVRATCLWRTELLAPLLPGESFGRRATQPQDNVILVAHPLAWAWWPVMRLEEGLLPTRLADELEVLEPPGTLCSLVVHVPAELGSGELRVEPYWLDLTAGGMSPVLFLDPATESSLHWFGADHRTVTFTFHPEAGRHHELTLPLE